MQPRVTVGLGQMAAASQRGAAAAVAVSVLAAWLPSALGSASHGHP